MSVTPALLSIGRAPSCVQKRLLRRLLALTPVCLLLAASYACGPDPTTEALRQENAALRRQNEHNQALADAMNRPLTDSARQNADGTAGRSAAISPPGDAAAVTEQDEQEAMKLGLPVYPGAVLFKAPGAKQDNSVLTGGGVNIVVLQTPDKLEKVEQFYTEKMTTEGTDSAHPGVQHRPARAERIQDKFRVVTLSDVQPGNGMRSVEIHEDVGRTYIQLLNITGKRTIPSGVLTPALGGVSAPRHDTGAAASTPTTPPAGSAAPADGAQSGDDPLHPTLLPKR